MLAAGGYGLLSVEQVPRDLLTKFDCGTAHLNEFLTDSAQRMHEHRLGYTSVVFHQEFQGVVGYFTLSNDSIPLKASEVFELGIEDELRAFPAVKIGRLAVARELQGQGTGTAVMKLVLGQVLDSKSLSSARLLIIDADGSEDVVRFYAQNGFERSLWGEDQAKNHRDKRSPKTVKMIRDVLRA